MFSFWQRSQTWRRRVRPLPLSFHPWLEVLEDRITPVGYFATIPGDAGVGQGIVGDIRYCINQANASVGVPDVINFNLLGAAQKIELTSPLPIIKDPLTINGYSQPGSSPNTLAIGDNAVLKIILDGSNNGRPVQDGLTIEASDTTIKGLVIQNFRENGILLDGINEQGRNVKIQGNFIGTSDSGITRQANGANGIDLFQTQGALIGGPNPADRNIISGNGAAGIDVVAGTGSNTIQGNYIGTDKNGTQRLSNGSHGIRILGAVPK